MNTDYDSTRKRRRLDNATKIRSYTDACFLQGASLSFDAELFLLGKSGFSATDLPLTISPRLELSLNSKNADVLLMILSHKARCYCSMSVLSYEHEQRSSQV